MEQISIWDILGETKVSDFPCDTCKHDIKGCCNYDEPLGRHCVLGDAYEPKEWKPLFIQDYIEWTSDKTMPLVNTYHEFSPTDDPDVICKGTVNGVPALIGFREWVSGWGSCFSEYEAFKWKEL